MRIEQFCSQFGENARGIDDLVRQWTAAEFDSLQKTHDEQDFDNALGAALIAGDALSGDGLLDQIPRELQDAFIKLMKENGDSLTKMRQILVEKIGTRGAGFNSFDDPQVRGFISKIKGQIGENIFQRHVGAAARLAPSGSQEAWDIAVAQPSGMHEYVQVKLYADPTRVVQKMLAIQEKVGHGLVEGIDGETVHHIDFAVPEDIADRVRSLMDLHSELHGIAVHSIPVTPGAAAEFVKQGLSNVGPGQWAHFFHQLLGGAVAAGSVHSVVNAFLWYKGAKEASEAIVDATTSTAISTVGIGMGLLAETLLHHVTMASGFGIGTRLVLARTARSRWNFAKFLGESIAKIEERSARLENLCTHLPRAS